MVPSDLLREIATWATLSGEQIFKIKHFNFINYFIRDCNLLINYLAIRKCPGHDTRVGGITLGHLV